MEEAWIVHVLGVLGVLGVLYGSSTDEFHRWIPVMDFPRWIPTIENHPTTEIPLACVLRQCVHTLETKEGIRSSQCYAQDPNIYKIPSVAYLNYRYIGPGIFFVVPSQFQRVIQTTSNRQL